MRKAEPSGKFRGFLLAWKKILIDEKSSCFHLLTHLLMSSSADEPLSRTCIEAQLKLCPVTRGGTECWQPTLQHSEVKQGDALLISERTYGTRLPSTEVAPNRVAPCSFITAIVCGKRGGSFQEEKSDVFPSSVVSASCSSSCTSLVDAAPQLVWSQTGGNARP